VSVAQVLRDRVTSASFSLTSDENLRLAWAIADDWMGTIVELSEQQKQRLLVQFKEWILSLTFSESASPLDDADNMRMTASQAFGAFARFAMNVEGGRDVIEDVAKRGRVPWSEGALPALVEMDLVDADVAIQELRAAMLGDLEQPAQLAAQATVVWTRRGPPSEVLEKLWETIGLAVVAGRPTTLVLALQVAGIGYRKYVSIMPVELDRLGSQGLDRVLIESDPTTRRLEQGYDLDRARLWGAVLAETMRVAKRGDESVILAWRKAAASDPIGDIARGFAMSQDLAIESE
jgi:hypothetical protein